jgi:streptogramin lyase
LVTEYSVGITSFARPHGIAAGPDGNIWFTELDGQIGRITPEGVVTEFSSGAVFGGITSITTGPDGNLWFTNMASTVGRITPAGVVTEFTEGITPGARPYDIVAGPDGNMWFTEGTVGVARITLAGVVTEFGTGTAAYADLQSITVGPDGNLWFINTEGLIGRVKTDGSITYVAPTGTNPSGIASGPDGNLWFTAAFPNRIGQMTPSGVVTNFAQGLTPNGLITTINVGSDGNLWFAEYGAHQIGRITPSGVITEFKNGITAGADPVEVVAGPDGSMWFTEGETPQIGRIVPPPQVLVSVVSRKVHGAAGTFDLPLSTVTTIPTVEPRLGPSHTLVFTFDRPISTADVVTMEGLATSGTPAISGNDVVVDIAAVSNQQYVTVSLTNVASADGGTGGTGSVRIGFLAGDVNQSRVVSVADLGLVNAQLTQTVTAANYLKDVNATGTLTIADKGITNTNLTKALPAP